MVIKREEIVACVDFFIEYVGKFFPNETLDPAWITEYVDFLEEIVNETLRFVEILRLEKNVSVIVTMTVDFLRGAIDKVLKIGETLDPTFIAGIVDFIEKAIDEVLRVGKEWEENISV